MQLINPTDLSVTVTGVRTIDPTTGRLLATTDASAVASLMTPFGTGGPSPTLRPGGAGFILMDVALSRAARLPASLVHDFDLSYSANPGLPNTLRTGSTTVVRDKPVVIDGPLTGPRWIAFNGCCASPNGHRTAVNPINGKFYVAERFAIDFVQLDSAGRIYRGDPTRLASYPGYGAHVISVASGVVVGTRDGMADNVPVGSIPPFTLDTIGGNYVVIDIGGGHFAYYAHLQPGSLRVHVGDRVRRGQLLGLVGNSGNTDFPHLHFHVMDTASPLASDGLPHEYRMFHSEGVVTNPDLLEGQPAVFDPALGGSHFRQLPVEFQSVDFPTTSKG